MPAAISNIIILLFRLLVHTLRSPTDPKHSQVGYFQTLPQDIFFSISSMQPSGIFSNPPPRPSDIFFSNSSIQPSGILSNPPPRRSDIFFSISAMQPSGIFSNPPPRPSDIFFSISSMQPSGIFSNPSLRYIFLILPHAAKWDIFKPFPEIYFSQSPPCSQVGYFPTLPRDQVIYVSQSPPCSRVGYFQTLPRDQVIYFFQFPPCSQVGYFPTLPRDIFFSISSMQPSGIFSNPSPRYIFLNILHAAKWDIFQPFSETKWYIFLKIL